MNELRGPQWQPIERLDCVLTLVRGMTEESREQRGLFREAGIAPLDAATITRARRAYADRLDLIALFREQLARWRNERPSRDQEKKLDEVQTYLEEDERLSREILRVVGYVSLDSGTGRASSPRSRN